MKARRHADEDIYWLSCQASELYLKALLAALTDPHLYTHDLGELLDSIKNLGIDVSEDTVMLTSSPPLRGEGSLWTLHRFSSSIRDTSAICRAIEVIRDSSHLRFCFVVADLAFICLEVTKI